MDVFASLLTLCCLWDLLKNPRDAQRKCLELRIGNEKWFSAFAAAIILSFAVSSTTSLSHVAFRMFELKWYLFIYVLLWTLRQTGLLSLRHVLSILALASGWAIFIWFLKSDPLHPSYDLAPWEGGIRTGGLLGNAMTFAHVYGIYFCFFSGWLIHMTLEKKAKPSGLVSLILLGSALLLSFTRGVWFAAALAISVFVWFLNNARARLFLLLACLAVATICLTVDPVKQRISRSLSTKDERSYIWQGHLEIFKDHPLFGVGYGENTEMLPEYYRKLNVPPDVIVSHAHNQYLHIAAGLGLIGLIAYLGVMISFLRMTLRRHLNTGSQQGLLGAIFTAQLFFLLAGLFESNFEHSKVKYVMCLVWAIGALLARGENLGEKLETQESSQ